MVDATLDARYKRLSQEYQRRCGERESVSRQLAVFEAERDGARSESEDLGKVLAIYHSMTSTVHQQFLEAIEKLVTSGLESVFGEHIQLTIRPSIRGRNVQLDFLLESEGQAQSDILSARGGGVVAVVGVLLRVVTIRLLAGRRRQVLFLDEPLAHLSAEFVPACAQLLSRLARDLAIQIFLITHQPEFAEAGDAVYLARRGKSGTELVEMGGSRDVRNQALPEPGGVGAAVLERGDGGS